MLLYSDEIEHRWVLNEQVYLVNVFSVISKCLRLKQQSMYSFVAIIQKYLITEYNQGQVFQRAITLKKSTVCKFVILLLTREDMKGRIVFFVSDSGPGLKSSVLFLIACYMYSKCGILLKDVE